MNKKEKTLMIHAAINLDEILFSVLMEYSADANVKDKECKTALFYALDQEKECLNIIRPLINLTNFNQEIFMISLDLAMKRSHIHALNILLEKNRHFINLQNKNNGNSTF